MGLTGGPLVAGAAIREMPAVPNAVYGPDSDFTAICEVIESRGGVKVRKYRLPYFSP